jgi:hypothetical protein
MIRVAGEGKARRRLVCIWVILVGYGCGGVSREELST